MGEQIYSGIKINGVVQTTPPQGVKINNEDATGFWLDGNWISVGPLIFTLSITTTESWYKGMVVFLNNGATTFNIIMDGEEKSFTASSAGGSVTLGRTDGIHNGAIIQVSDTNIKEIDCYVAYDYTTSSGKTKTSYICSLGKVIQWGNLFKGVIVYTSDAYESTTTYPKNLPACMNTYSITTTSYLPYCHTSAQSSNYSGVMSIPYCHADNLYTTITDKGSTCQPLISNYSIQYQRVLSTNCTFLTQSKYYGNYNDTRANVDTVYVIPYKVKKIIPYSYTDTTDEETGVTTRTYTWYPPFYDAKKQVYLCVFWDKNGKHVDGSTVENYEHIIRTSGTPAEGYYTPIVKYYGEWNETFLKENGYDMNLYRS